MDEKATIAGGQVRSVCVRFKTVLVAKKGGGSREERERKIGERALPLYQNTLWAADPESNTHLSVGSCTVCHDEPTYGLTPIP